MAKLMARQSATTVFVAVNTRTAGDLQLCALYIADFPAHAPIVGIYTALAAIENIADPLPLATAKAMLDARKGTAPAALIHWAQEPGLWRVATATAGMIKSIVPKVKAMYIPAEVR